MASSSVLYVFFVGTCLFTYYKLKYYERVGKYGMGDDVVGDDKIEMKQVDEEKYVHPGMWDVTMDLEDINRLDYSIKTAQHQVDLP